MDETSNLTQSHKHGLRLGNKFMQSPNPEPQLLIQLIDPVVDDDGDEEGLKGKLKTQLHPIFKLKNYRSKSRVISPSRRVFLSFSSEKHGDKGILSKSKSTYYYGQLVQ